MLTQSAVVLRETSVMGSLASCLFWIFPFLSKGKFYIFASPHSRRSIMLLHRFYRIPLNPF